jgi:hypothetical protein
MKPRTAKILKWIAGVVFAFGLAYIGLLFYVNRALHNAYAALEAEGRPMKPEQIIPPEIPDADNAALVYESVVLQLKSEKVGEESLLEKLANLAEEILGQSEEVLDEHSSERARNEFWELSQTKIISDALEALQRGTAKPDCRFNLDYSKGFEMEFGPFGELMNLSDVLCAYARGQAEDGNMTASWDAAISALRFADAYRDEPLLISQLVRNTQFAYAVLTIQELTKNSLPTKPQFEQLDRSLEHFDTIGPLVDSLDGERLLMADPAFSNLESLASGLAEPNTSALDRLGMSFHLYSPFLKLDHATYLNFIREGTALFAQPYSISDGDFENDALGDLPWYAILAAMVAPSFSQAKIAGVSMIAQARITRVGLVVLKHKEEKGAYPETLSDLGKGEWIDPFTGKPLIYKTSPSGFMAYSLGENQVDDNGMEAAPETEGKGDLVWRYPE